MKHIIQHNLRQSSVLFTDKHFETKLLAPSLGIVRKDNIITGYGEICLFSNSDNILRGSKIYSNDIYSPRLDFLVSKIDEKKLKEINQQYDLNITIQDGFTTKESFEKKYKPKLRGEIEGDEEFKSLSRIFKQMNQEYINNLSKAFKDYLPLNDFEINNEVVTKLNEDIKKIKEELNISDLVTSSMRFNNMLYKGFSDGVKKETFDELFNEKNIDKFKELINLTYQYEVEQNIIRGLLYAQGNKIIEWGEKDTLLEDNYLEKFKNKDKDRVVEFNKKFEEVSEKYNTYALTNKEMFEEKFNQIFESIIKPDFYMEDKQNQITGKYSLKKMDNEKILKELTSNIVNGENFYGGEFVYFRNAMADQYSLNEYSKFTNRLSSNEEESQKSIKTFDTYIENKYKMNSLEFYKKFENGEIDRNDYKELRNEFNKIFQPHYMEAKPLREISYNEFNFAFVPENCDKDVIKILEQNGLDIHYYEENEDLNIKLLNLTIETSNDKKEIEELCEHTNDDISLKAMDRLSTFDHNLKETINEASNYSNSNVDESTNSNKHKHR